MAELLAIGPLVVGGLVLVAFIAGWVDAVVGGGGLIQLPSLLIGLPAETTVAEISGTNKVSSAAGTLIATITYLRKVAVHWPLALALMAGSAIGSALGAQLVRFLPKDWFTPIVLVALLAVGTYTIRKPQMGLEHEPRQSRVTAAVIAGGIGLAVGLYDGFLGPGTGSFFVILIVAVLGYGFLQATVLAKLANLTTNIAAISVFAVHGQVLWLLGGMMALANLGGAFVGARMALKHGNGFVRRVFLVVIAVLSVKLAYDTVVLFF